ncbi:hypothetical protein L195_g064639, partial [Trifolium pratense]
DNGTQFTDKGFQDFLAAWGPSNISPQWNIPKLTGKPKPPTE